MEAGHRSLEHDLDGLCDRGQYAAAIKLLAGKPENLYEALTSEQATINVADCLYQLRFRHGLEEYKALVREVNGPGLASLAVSGYECRGANLHYDPAVATRLWDRASDAVLGHKILLFDILESEAARAVTWKAELASGTWAGEALAASAEWDHDATCAAWERALEETFSGRLRRYSVRWLLKAKQTAAALAVIGQAEADQTVDPELLYIKLGSADPRAAVQLANDFSTLDCSFWHLPLAYEVEHILRIDRGVWPSARHLLRSISVRWSLQGDWYRAIKNLRRNIRSGTSIRHL